MKYVLLFSMSLISLAAFASKPLAQQLTPAQQKSAPEVPKGGAGPSGYIAPKQPGYTVPKEQKVRAEPTPVQNANAAMANNAAVATTISFAAAFEKKLQDMEMILYNFMNKILPAPSEPDSDDEDDNSIKATATMINKNKTKKPDLGAAAW